MALKQYECPNCGSSLQVSADGKIGICSACDSSFVIEDEVVRHRLEGMVTVDGLTSRAQLHKRAEQFMQQGQYAEAASLYHEIIDKHDAHDSDAWWGLARVCAQDFRDPEHRITREQLGLNYLRAIGYAAPEKREAYEKTIREHEELYRNIIAEREAKLEAERERARAEAARRRERQLQAEAEESRRRKEREALERERQARQEAAHRVRRRRIHCVILVLLALALCTGTYVWFIAIPNSRYQAAMDLMEQGDYAGAREGFEHLGGHKDSAQRAMECTALEALAASDVEGVLDTLDSLRQAGETDTVRRIQDVAAAAIENWRENGFSPRVVLTFLQTGASLDLDGVLDAETLFTQAHVALAGGESLLSWRMQDVDGDGEEELLALESDWTLRAYRMAPLENQETALSVEMQAQVFSDIGADSEQTDIDMAISCYMCALELHGSPQNRERAANACLRRAASRAESGEAILAMEDAETAVDMLDTQGTFAVLYEIAVAASQNNADMQEGVDIWEDFCARYAEQLECYALNAEADAHSGALRLVYANALAADNDIACIDWYAAARDFGVPVLEDMDAAAMHFDVGSDRLALRFAALEIAESAQEDLTARRDTLVLEIEAALAKWESALTDFSRVFKLLKAARESEMEIDAEAADAAYRQSALTQLNAQQVIHASAFYDWDGDGWDEAVVLTGAQAALCIPTEEGWRCASTADVPAMSGPLLEIQASVVLARDAQSRDFAALIVENGELHIGYAAQNAQNFELREDGISFSCTLEGSIERYATMYYALDAPHDAPVLECVNWQKEAYPQPQRPQDAALRLLETLYYGIPEETAILTGAEVPDAVAADYTAAALVQTPLPNALTQIRCAVCLWSEDGSYAVVEACYEAEDGAITRYFVAVPDQQGGWILAAASPSCGGLGEETGDTTLAPLPVNAAAEGALAQREKRAWRVLLPYPAEVTLAWNASEAEGAFSAVLARDGENVIAYRLGSGASQRTNVFYLPPDVYTLTLTSAHSSLEQFSLTFSAIRNEHIELEPNDTIASATPIVTGAAVSASLQTEEDVDIYCFTLDEPGRVRATLAGAADAYALSLAASDARALLAVPAGGEAETPELYLDVGDYILQVSPGAVWTADPYTLSVEYVADTLVERERNDTPQTATPIAGNTSMTGRFNSLADVDCYALTLDQSMLVQLHLDFAAQNGSREGVALTLYSGETPLFSATALESESQILSPEMALPAGRYTLHVENRRMEAKDYALRVETVLPEGATLEAEPNDAPDTATVIAANASVTGSLLPRAQGKDVDTYAFTLDAPGAATLSVAFAPPQGGAGSYYILALADESRSTVWSGAISAAESASPTLYLGAGTYYAQVTQGRNEWPGAYTLCMDYEARDDGESERNDTAQSAAPIAANTPIHGNFLSSSDVDWFRLELDASAVIQLQLKFAPLEQNERTYILTLTDGRQEYLRANVRGQESDFASAPVCLSAGVYYIQLENPAFAAQEYELTVVCAPVQAVEVEPNDTLAEATPLTNGLVYSGVLSSRQDVDVYLLTIVPGESPMLSFGFTPSGGDEAAYALSLEQNGRVLWDTQVSAASGGLNAAMQIPAGEYYLSVTPENWTSAVYTISVS